jgi:hypothetical protein
MEGSEMGTSDIIDMFVGQSERNIHELFEIARRNAPCVLFLDEVDAIGQKRSQLRHTPMRSAVNQLLLELDDVSGNNEGVFLLAATNHPWDVDSALRRPGRFDRTLLVLPPDAAAREGVLRAEDLISGEQDDRARAAVRAVPRDPYQVAVFQISGGTTGVPKVIPRMQNDYLLNAERTIEVMGFAPDDVLFMPMPMIHNAAMICFWLPCLLAGAAFAIPRDMTPESWGQLFRDKKPTFIGLIRALLPRLDSMLEQGLGNLASVRGAWAPDARAVSDRHSWGAADDRRAFRA